MLELPNFAEIRVTSLARRGINAPRHVFREFLRFLTKGNVVQLSIAVILGTAFNAVINSIVLNFINPFIGLLGAKNLENFYVPLSRCGNDCNYSTPADANKNNVVTLNVGAVASSIITFILVTILCYVMANTLLKYMNKNFKDDDRDDCIYCFEKIRIAAVKCPFCHTLNPFQDAETLKSSSLNHNNTTDKAVAQETHTLLVSPQLIK
eukprot:NODE_145_length_17646_cov_0.204536.p8 type:complete len:208 gc:universal NODE_145_length_17646_cov_0.204536:513-1136(+)